MFKCLHDAKAWFVFEYFDNEFILQIGGIGKGPLAGLAALGLGGLAPSNTGGLNPAGKQTYLTF